MLGGVLRLEWRCLAKEEAMETTGRDIRRKLLWRMEALHRALVIAEKLDDPATLAATLAAVRGTPEDGG